MSLKWKRFSEYNYVIVISLSQLDTTKDFKNLFLAVFFFNLLPDVLFIRLGSGF